MYITGAFNTIETYIPAGGAARTYKTFTESNLDNAVSRIYGGVHFRYSNVAAAPIGIGAARSAYQYIYGPNARFVSKPLSFNLLDNYYV